MSTPPQRFQATAGRRRRRCLGRLAPAAQHVGEHVVAQRRELGAPVHRQAAPGDLDGLVQSLRRQLSRARKKKPGPKSAPLDRGAQLSQVAPGGAPLAEELGQVEAGLPLSG